MVATIQLTAASSDLKGYLNAWDAANPVTPYGTFNPGGDLYNQWVGGDETPSAYGVILDGNFDGYANGNLTGVATGLTFGTGLAYDSGDGVYELANEQLSIDLNNANVDPFDTFDYTIYGLINSDVSYLYAHFDAVGTEQIGTTGADRLYSFAGDDTLTGGNGNDTFVFAEGWDNDLITDFLDYSDNDVIDLSGLSSATKLAIFLNTNSSSASDLIISDGVNTIEVDGVAGNQFASLVTNGNILI